MKTSNANDFEFFKEKKRNLVLELTRLEELYSRNLELITANDKGNADNTIGTDTTTTHANTATNDTVTKVAKKPQSNAAWQKTALMICDKFIDHKTGPLFTKIPTYSDYSEAIKSPISLETIKQRIRSRVN
jgi:Bromodomain